MIRRPRFWLGFGRGMCTALVAAVVTDSVPESLLVMALLLLAFVLTDAMSDL